eukprot:240681-Hanusia_phi.AAC.1
MYRQQSEAARSGIFQRAGGGGEEGTAEGRMETDDTNTYDAVIHGADDYTCYALGYSLEQALWCNVANHLTDGTPWTNPDALRKEGVTNMMNFLRSNEMIDRRRRHFEGMDTVTSLFMQSGLQGWVTQQTIPGRFLCTVCGRNSIVDVTAIPGPGSRGRGVCICCVNMPGVPFVGLQDHPTNDVFYTFACRELAALFPRLTFSVNIDRPIITSKKNDRPDLSIYVTYEEVNDMAIFIETDPGCKKDDEIKKKDDLTLSLNHYKGPKDNIQYKVIVRVNTDIYRKSNYSNNLFLLVWLVLHGIVDKFNRDIKEWKDRSRVLVPGSKYDKIFINYPYSNAYYTLLGFKLHCTNGTDVQFPHLMQMGYKNAGSDLQTAVTDFPTHRELLYYMMCDPLANPFVIIYCETRPRLAYVIPAPGGELDMAAILARPDSDEVQVQYFQGLFYDKAAPANIVDARSVRFGKILLVRMLLFYKNRWSTRTNARFDRTRANKENAREKEG